MPACPFCTKEVPTASTICPHCLRALPVSVTTARPAALPGMSRRWLRPTVLVLALLAAGGYGMREYRHEHARDAVVLTTVGEERPITGPVTTTIAPPLDVHIADTASVSIPPGGHLSYTFSGGGRASCRVHGTVRALPGGDRQVDVFVVDRDGLADIESGRTPRTYYDSGVVSDVMLDVSLDGRSQYTLVVANTRAGRRAKTVQLKGVGASCAD